MKFFWTLLAFSFIFTAAGMFKFLRKGVPLEPTRVLDPTAFSTPEQVGAAIFRRYFPQFNEGHVFIFASQESLHSSARIWGGLLALAHEKNWHADAVFTQSGLPPIGDAKSVPFDDYKKILIRGDSRVILQMTADAETLRNLHNQFPKAVIISQEAYPAKMKIVNPAMLTAAAEVSDSGITHLYLKEP